MAAGTRSRRSSAIPPGMPRQMALPLPPLPAGSTALRLRTSQEIYWDRIAVVYSEPLPGVRRQVMAMRGARAQLRRLLDSDHRCAAHAALRRQRERAARRHAASARVVHGIRTDRSARRRRGSCGGDLRSRRSGRARLRSAVVPRSISKWYCVLGQILQAARLVQGHGSLHARWRNHRAAARETTRPRGPACIRASTRATRRGSESLD